MRKYTVVRSPSSVTSMMFADIKEFMNKVYEKRQLIIDPRFTTKTRVQTSVRAGEFNFGLNKNIEGYKLVEKEEYSWFTHDRHTKYYFKKLKSQGFKEYVEYINKALDKLNFPQDIELVFWELKGFTDL